MVDAPNPIQHPLFIARSDWRDEGQYPSPNLLDPSIWAWELLRRNSEYARDYEICHSYCVDVPAVPYAMDTLTNYLCDPEPNDPSMPYKEYKKRHREHFIFSVKDAVRKKWQINEMPDPKNGWHEIFDPSRNHDSKNKLAWLFACNTVDIVNPPTRWTIRTQPATKVTGVCVENEVLVRLDLTGNLDEQVASLRRQIAGFFTGINRSGSLRVGQYEDFSESATGTYSQRRQTGEDADTQKPILPPSPYEPIVPAAKDWNKVLAKQKSLHYVVRMADAIASLEQGTLASQLREHGVDVGEIGTTTEDAQRAEQHHSTEQPSGPASGENLYPAMCKALAQYFSVRRFADDKRDADYKKVCSWVSLASELVAEGNHISIARINMHKEKARTKRSSAQE